MNLGLFLMIVVGMCYILVVKMFYNSLQRKQKRIDFEESRKNATLNKTLKKGKKK